MSGQIARMIQALAIKEQCLQTIKRTIEARAEALAIRDAGPHKVRGAPGWTAADEVAFQRSAASLAQERAGEIESLCRKIERQRRALDEAVQMAEA
jgi:hypothetical protein